MREPMMTQAEADFLERHIRPDDVTWEWGAGYSTPWLASVTKRITTVEHNRSWAISVLTVLPATNASLVWVPPGPMWDGKSDGTYDEFRGYVDAYTGQGVTLVLIDGRARVACARRLAETAPYGPHRDMRIFLHDADRAEYARITAPADADEPGWLDEVERVGTLALLRARV